MTPPLSLYIHIPWCVRKCPYCDFNSHQSDNFDQHHYIQCLLADLKHDIEHFHIERPIQSIFIGGGTPSLFSGTIYTELLNSIAKEVNLAADIEITMEANPGTIEHDKFDHYLQAGINRISLGVQSFADDKLSLLGRIHSGQEAIKAIKTVQDAGFNNINLDLMFGLPQQSIEQGMADLQQAIDLQPTHISWYQLTLEPNTVFYKKPPRLPNEDLIAELHDQGQPLLTENGYAQYEISAYARNSKPCRHNLNYWQFGDYIGIGAGAHGKITLSNGSVQRTRKVKQPESYQQRLPQNNFLAEKTTIVTEQLPFEYFLNRLRLNQPIALDQLPITIDLQLTDQNSPLQQALSKGLLTIDEKHITKTTLGQRFLNDLLTLFL